MLLNLDDLSKHPIPLLHIGQPHRFTHSDGLKPDPLPLSGHLGLTCHPGPHGHIVMLTQRCLDDNRVRRLCGIYRHDLAMNPIAAPIGCLALGRKADEQHQRNDCE